MPRNGQVSALTCNAVTRNGTAPDGGSLRLSSSQATTVDEHVQADIAMVGLGGGHAVVCYSRVRPGWILSESVCRLLAVRDGLIADYAQEQVLATFGIVRVNQAYQQTALAALDNTAAAACYKDGANTLLACTVLLVQLGTLSVAGGAQPRQQRTALNLLGGKESLHPTDWPSIAVTSSISFMVCYRAAVLEGQYATSCTHVSRAGGDDALAREAVVPVSKMLLGAAARNFSGARWSMASFARRGLFSGVVCYADVSRGPGEPGRCNALFAGGLGSSADGGGDAAVAAQPQIPAAWQATGSPHVHAGPAATSGPQSKLGDAEQERAAGLPANGAGAEDKDDSLSAGAVAGIVLCAGVVCGLLTYGATRRVSVPTPSPAPDDLPTPRNTRILQLEDTHSPNSVVVDNRSYRHYGGVVEC